MESHHPKEADLGAMQEYLIYMDLFKVITGRLVLVWSNSSWVNWLEYCHNYPIHKLLCFLFPQGSWILMIFPAETITEFSSCITSVVSWNVLNHCICKAKLSFSCVIGISSFLCGEGGSCHVLLCTKEETIQQDCCELREELSNPSTSSSTSKGKRFLIVSLCL